MSVARAKQEVQSAEFVDWQTYFQDDRYLNKLNTTDRYLRQIRADLYNRGRKTGHVGGDKMAIEFSMVTQEDADTAARQPSPEELRHNSMVAQVRHISAMGLKPSQIVGWGKQKGKD